METDSFETDLRQILARHAAEVPGEAVERLQRLRYRPRTPGRAGVASAGLAGAGLAGAGLAGAAAILGLDRAPGVVIGALVRASKECTGS